MIIHVQEKYPLETMQARRDFAHITKSRLVEPPYWFRDTETEREYHGIYGCIGWPQRLSEKMDKRDGYAAIVGVRKIADQDAAEAKIDVLDEIEERVGNEGILINRCIEMRKRWGFGVHRDLMPVFFGDYRPFELVVAYVNTKMLEAGAKETDAFVVSPPDDYEAPNAFDIYVSSLGLVLSRQTKRLRIGKAEVIKNRISAFKRDDPAIMALGGLMHTLLLRQPWMEQATPSVWRMPDV